MATWDITDKYYSGQGVVMVAQRDTDGSPMGFTPVGNVPDLKMSIAVSNLEHKESHTGQRGTDKRIPQETKVTLSMTMENFISENLARVSRGTSTLVAAGALTNYVMTGYMGLISSVGKIKLSNVVVKTAADVTLTEDPGDGSDWDYRVNAEAGSIYINEDSASWDALVVGDFTDEAVGLKVSASYAEQNVVDGMAAGAEELFLRFEGLNTAEENEPVVIEVFKFSTDPFKELALISDGIQSFVLEGSVLSDSTRTTGSKYFQVTKVG